MALGLEPKLIQLPQIHDERGRLSVAERLGFEIKRVYWIYWLAEHAQRGGHAHKALKRLVIALSGAFRATVEHETGWATYQLDSPSEALYVPPMAWLDLGEFKRNAVCLVLASAEYDEADYIREKDEWARQVSR